MIDAMRARSTKSRTNLGLKLIVKYCREILSIELLRDHVATDLNICCTVFPDVFFRFRGEPLMYFEPFQPSNRLLVLKTASNMTSQNSTFAILLSKIAPFQGQI